MEEGCKKRKSFGRMTEVMKKLRLATHESGEECECQRLNCFAKIKDRDRKRIISYFNCLGTYDIQNQYLAGLVTVVPVAEKKSSG